MCAFIHVSASVSLCAHVCICASVCIHLYIIMCSAEPEVAVLDCMTLKQIQYIGKGGGGVAELQLACEAHIQGGKFWGIPPEFLGGF